MSTPPNFVCFVADQFRFDMMGCAGHPAKPTPHIDRLAAEGVRFDRCYSVHPLCMPTRATWLTGRAPRGHRVRCNGVPLDPRLPTMTQALADAGYLAHSIGKIHASPWMHGPGVNPDEESPEDWPEGLAMWASGRIRSLPRPYFGFQTAECLCGSGRNVQGDYARWLLEREPKGRELLGPPPGVEMNFERRVERTWTMELPQELHALSWAAERAEAFLEKAAAEGRSFFLWVSIPDPHPPYAAPEPWGSMYGPEDTLEPVRREGELDGLPPHYRRLFETGIMKTAGRIAPTNVPDDARHRVRAMALGMVSQFDAMVGRVMEKIEALGLDEGTASVFMSDHGQMLGDHWMFSMPPCHMDGTLRVPSVWRWPGRFRQGATSAALASHLDFAPTVLDLADVPVPEGRTPPQPEAPGQRPPWPGRSLAPMLDGTAESVQDSVVAENDEDYLGLRMRTLITEGHHITVYAGEEYGEMYDLREDPCQLRNLWADPARRPLRRELESRLLHRMAETDDALPRRMGHA